MALTLSPKALSLWTWRAGMAAIDRYGRRWRICEGESGHLYAVGEPQGHIGGWLLSVPIIEPIPDLTDPVTADSLPRMVREAWNRPGACAFSREIMPRGSDELQLCWVVEIQPGVQFTSSTELAAWIAALEAAPCPDVEALVNTIETAQQPKRPTIGNLGRPDDWSGWLVEAA